MCLTVPACGCLDADGAGGLEAGPNADAGLSTADAGLGNADAGLGADDTGFAADAGAPCREAAGGGDREETVCRGDEGVCTAGRAADGAPLVRTVAAPADTGREGVRAAGEREGMDLMSEAASFGCVARRWLTICCCSIARLPERASRRRENERKY